MVDAARSLAEWRRECLVLVPLTILVLASFVAHGSILHPQAMGRSYDEQAALVPRPPKIGLTVRHRSAK